MARRVGPADGPRILLVSMPFGALERPGLGLGLLQAAARRDGFSCTTRYFGFDLADAIGTSVYQWLTHTVPYETFAGDWLFTDSLYGEDPLRAARFRERILQPNCLMSPDDVQTLDRLRPVCSAFIEQAVHSVSWEDYDIVGFTSTFQQNIASLAMATKLKERFAHLTTLFGGANWEGEMGVALHESFPAVDLVCSGEADHSFPELLAALRDGKALDDVGGMVYRDSDGATVATGPSAPIEDLDALPIPDFEPFFSALGESRAVDDVSPNLLLETARGCWWGAHSHCTFCGLNGASMSFRSKHPERVLDELDALADEWGVETVSVVDNILDMRYFRTLLPELARSDRNLHFFWEVKSNLSRSQVQQLADAGVDHVQPGIESLSDEVLGLMRKGTTRLRNVAMLKWCREYGIVPEWNLLYGFPGETPDEYAEMETVFAAISHLQPPSGHGQIRLDRFSPFHHDPEAFGMLDVRPSAPFEYLYDVEPEVLMRIAYYFDFTYHDGRQPSSYASGVLRAIESWKRRHDRSELWMMTIGLDDTGDTSDTGEKGHERHDGGRTVVIIDRRGTNERVAELGGWKAEVYDACDRGRTREELDQLEALAGVDAAEVTRFLDRCCATGVMLGDGSSYLATAVHTPPRRVRQPSPIRHIPVTVAP
jgi:ribosomal peptide maturation radical SAM protein 1